MIPLSSFRIAIGQINSHVGNLAGNVRRIREFYRKACAAGADLALTPECSLIGYSPEDLVLRPDFVRFCEDAFETLALETTPDTALVVGGVWQEEGKIYNGVQILNDGRVLAKIAKYELPNYGVFDDKRLFNQGLLSAPFIFRGVSLGFLICEDWWHEAVPAFLAGEGADILISLNASPFEENKLQTRLNLAKERVAAHHLPFIFCGLTGGQDDLVFDGSSFALNSDGSLVALLKFCAEDFALLDWHKTYKTLSVKRTSPKAVPAEPYFPSDAEQKYTVLVSGLQDYVRKNKFPGVLLGLSGGIDSALTAAIAADALGAAKVKTYMLPSPYTSQESLEDAALCAKLSGISHEVIPINQPLSSLLSLLTPLFEGKASDTTEENIQSRVRGLILMALSNKHGSLLLSTGNKSEMATGYATLYGDMCGGYNVLKDVYKTEVFALARFRNSFKPAYFSGSVGPVIPQNVIDKPPSAELRPDQKDEDSLPPYPVLDAILRGLIEEKKSVTDLVKSGFTRTTVLDVRNLLRRAEYKRRQSPPGPKITSQAFTRERRYPITNGYSPVE